MSEVCNCEAKKFLLRERHTPPEFLADHLDRALGLSPETSGALAALSATVKTDDDATLERRITEIFESGGKRVVEIVTFCKTTKIRTVS